MADETEAERETRLRREYHGQTARIAWAELAPHFAAGKVIHVSEELNLVEVAVNLGLDNVARFEAWTSNGLIAPLSDDSARYFSRQSAVVWAVVAPPWVLVQGGVKAP
ncbi:MAG: DUF2288 domain-containing protein [Chromatocurvus sp.]